MLRWGLGGLVLAAIVVGGAANGRAQVEPTPDLAAEVADLRTRLVAVERQLAARPIGTAVPEGVRFAGQGDVVSEPFPLREGLVIARIEAQGEGDVAATLYDGRGKAVPFGTKELPYAGSLADGVPAAGDYVLAVRSEGTWSVVLEQ